MDIQPGVQSPTTALSTKMGSSWMTEIQSASDPLSVLIPGEPQGLDEICRTDLRFMHAHGDPENLRKLEAFVKNREGEINSFAVLGISIPIVLSFFLLLFGQNQIQHISDAYPNAVGLVAISYFIAFMSWIGFVLYKSDALMRRLSPLRYMLNSLNSSSWPYRLRSALSRAEEKGLKLSMELQALLALLNGDVRDSIWSVLVIADQIGMSDMSRALDGQVSRLHRGAFLELGGETSELLHRSCSAVMPGRLDSLMDELERPPTVKV